MTKKQFGIIFTLMALIVCVGVISAKLNTNGVIDPSDLSQVLANQENKTQENKTQENNEDKQTLSTQEVFSLRSTKDQLYSSTIQDLKTIIADANTSQEKKDLATSELQEKTMKKDKEGRIESNVMSKGFEDVLCFIEGNKVRVVIKVGEDLNEEQTSAIQEIVEDVSSISEVIIEPKK